MQGPTQELHTHNGSYGLALTKTQARHAQILTETHANSMKACGNQREKFKSIQFRIAKL